MLLTVLISPDRTKHIYSVVKIKKIIPKLEIYLNLHENELLMLGNILNLMHKIIQFFGVSKLR